MLRLPRRMQGGFTISLAMRLSPDGVYAMASAVHPAPFLKKQQLELPACFPLACLPTPAKPAIPVAKSSASSGSVPSSPIAQRR
jgi:hypothetical protein